ncbi:hypothetical protein KMW28_01720 [Flammeovirga yaeyamensis]|uniref:Lipopolysaccharide biosynthesis protein n=1 Tax=Flammeovirga yaeyamensis TaxID=367791 RepID=A0AAX1N559_9BACT|nr:hypothetical protein [Flammeovirga yaeyamensis]MBB3699805.1 hypothetical protein [Flammeovirga yaeyamensis]NMF36626.1 hypothetical protein [Flammeovirga yaeyamensis]QWG02327.1 hypothetical protein KMW28_01720 [Flammeovirga yaeyamensis]
MEHSNKDTGNQSSKNKNDEIDLIELFSIIGDKIKSVFSGVFGAFISLLVYLYKKIYTWKIVVGIVVVIGGITGYLMKNTSQYYSSKASINSPYLKGVDFTNELNELNALCNEDGWEKLSKQLNLPLNIVSNISEISAIGYTDKYLKGKVSEEILDSLLMYSLQNEERFDITVSTKTNDFSKEDIQKGFEYFFDKNRYINKYKKVYQSGLKDRELTLIDQKQKLKEFNEAYKEVIKSQAKLTSEQSSNVLRLSSKNDEGIIKESGDKSMETMLEERNLSESLVTVRKQLTVEGNVEFVNRFSELNTVSLSTKGKTALGMFIGFVSILAFVILVDLNRYLKKKSEL